MLFEVLESRRLLSAALDLQTHVLTVAGTGGNDTILISQNASQLQVAVGLTVDSFLPALINSILVKASAGNDLVDLRNGVSIPAKLLAGDGNDTLYGGSASNTIVGGHGNDCLFGGAGDDNITGISGKTVINGGAGNDTLNGGIGTNRYYFDPSPGPATTVINQPTPGQGGELNFTSLTADIPLNVNLTSDSQLATYTNRTVSTALPGQAANFWQVRAGAGLTTITGNGNLNMLIAGTGNTTFNVGAGSATLVGGPGSSTFVFGANTASGSSAPGSPGVNLAGKIPVDILNPGTGPAALDFSAMPSTVGVTVDLTSDANLGSYAGRTLRTQYPHQAGRFTTVLGGAGNDKITGGWQADSLVANAGSDTLIGGPGSDTLVAGSGPDTLIGGGGNNTYQFAPQSQTVTYTIDQSAAGKGGLDFGSFTADVPVVANLLSDTLATYTNVTIQDAQPGEWANFNFVFGGAGNDHLTANNTGDTLFDGSGNDTLVGGTGADYLQVGNGNSLISGNGGADTIFAGSGIDTIYATNSADDPVNNAPAQASAPKQLVVKNTGAFIFTGAGTDSVVGGPGDDTIICSSTNDTIHGMGGNDNIHGGNGTSLIFGDAGNDTIVAGSGDTTISGGTGVDKITGGDGTAFIDKNLPDNASTATLGAVIDASALTTDAIAFALGNPSTAYPMVGSPGPGDQVHGGTGSTIIIGGAGDDTLIGGDGFCTIVAGSGNDVVIGGNGPDYLQGGAGNDVITAGGAASTLVGGTGSTVFGNNNGFANTVTGGLGLNIAQQDPTGTTQFTNIGAYYTNTQSTIIPGPGSPTSKALAAAPLLLPSAPSAAYVFNGVLYAGTTSMTTQEKIVISENLAGDFTVTQLGAPTQSFPAGSGIAQVVVYNGSGNNDLIDLRNIRIPAYVQTGSGSNTVYGGSGNDTLIGGAGNNTIYGQAGVNYIYGGGGNDVLFGGPTADYINPGIPNVFISNNHANTTIYGGTGSETLSFAFNLDNLDIRLDKGIATNLTTGTMTHIHNIRFVAGGDGLVNMVGIKGQSCRLYAGAGGDTIFGQGTADYLQGGPSSDHLFEETGNGIINTQYIRGALNSTDFYNKGTGKFAVAYVAASDVLVPLLHPT